MFLKEAMMRLLLPISLLLIVSGSAGYVASCFGTAVFDGSQTETTAAQLDDQTDALAEHSDRRSTRVILAPLAGLTLAAGAVCLMIALFSRRAETSAERPPDSQSPASRSEPPSHRV
jgi:hypothetical protein